MKTVILCGGRGYRLKEETDFKPKPMITIGGKPILWHIMKIYQYSNFSDFVIALGYMGDLIKEYFLNHKYFAHDFTIDTKTGSTEIISNSKKRVQREDFKITFVDTGAETLTGERVRRIKKYTDGKTFMLTYGDGVGNIDIKRLIAFHKKRKVLATLTGVHARSRWGQIECDENFIVTALRQKPILNEYINGGFMVLESDFFKYIKPDEMVEVALERLAMRRQLAVFKHEGFWHAMDTYQDMKDLNDLWENGAPPWRMWK